MKTGYARVRTFHQNLDLQLDDLKSGKSETILKEKVTGKNKSWPQMEKTIDQLCTCYVIRYLNEDPVGPVIITEETKLLQFVGD